MKLYVKYNKEKHGHAPNPAILFNGTVNLMNVMKAVKDEGGVVEATRQDRWGLIAHRCGYYHKDAGEDIEQIYDEWLSEFVCDQEAVIELD